MRIVMFTNTYTPIVGGLERSIMSFAGAFRRRGHDVLIVAPTFEDMPARERDVLRVPGWHHITRNDFSMPRPLPRQVRRQLDRFRPDIVHAHHPFLLGSTALRLARIWQRPLIFTHHIFFEQYVHYLKPLKPAVAERFLTVLATGYANLCDHVFAPSDSMAAHLRAVGVTAPLTVVPTGIVVRRFADGHGAGCRRRWGIPHEAFVVGHVGRLAPEKNLGFLGYALTAFLKAHPQAHALIGGEGPSHAELQQGLTRAGVARRVHFAGKLGGQALVDAYHAIDVFAFASKSETQGIVLLEAMAAGCPIVALDAPGVREVVKNEVNGRLLPTENAGAFADALGWLRARSAAQRAALQHAARQTAAEFSVARCAARALMAYREVAAQPRQYQAGDVARWQKFVRRLRAERAIAATMTRAARAAFAFKTAKAESRSSGPGP